MSGVSLTPSKQWHLKPQINTNPSQSQSIPKTLSFHLNPNPRSSSVPRSLSSSSSSSSLPPLVVVGSANADIYLEIERLPVAGETISAVSGHTLPGGKGANQAACGGRLSHPTFFLGQVGRDANGTMLTDELERGGVVVDHVRTVDDHDVATGHAVVMLMRGGENSIIIVGGANMRGWPQNLSPRDLELVRGAGIVLLQREIPDFVNLQVAKAANAAGVPVILDAGGMDAPIPQELLMFVDILSPNETELARLTGLPTENFEQINTAVTKCHEMGVEQVLMKLGDKGSALFIKGEEPIKQPIIAAAKVVDTTGAGDTFTAAFAVALVEGKSRKECLRFAAAAASLCVQVKGAIPSMPDRKSVLDLLQFS